MLLVMLVVRLILVIPQVENVILPFLVMMVLVVRTVQSCCENTCTLDYCDTTTTGCVNTPLDCDDGNDD